MGKEYLQDFAEYATEKIPVRVLKRKTYIGVDNMLPNRGGITTSDYLPTEGSATKFVVGDILIGNIRPYFKKIWIAEFDGGCSADVLVIRSKGRVTPQFLYACLSSNDFFHYDMAGAKGSKMPRGDKNHIMKFPISIPKNQEKIGLLISNINSKISLNNAISIELEALAKTLYDYWFVQFDFPDESGKPYKSSGGKMVWNGELKREIPEGWEVQPLNSLCNIVLGGTPKTEESTYWNGNISWLNSGEVAQFPVISSAMKITQDGVDNSATSLMPINTVVVSITGNIRASYLAIDSCANQSVVGILESNNLKKSYLYPVISNMILNYKRISTGNCQQHINKGTIEDTLVIIPNSTILDRYYQSVDNAYSLLTNLSQENQKLSSLRDFLLPLLMNGQVVINE